MKFYLISLLSASLALFQTALLVRADTVDATVDLSGEESMMEQLEDMLTEEDKLHLLKQAATGASKVDSDVVERLMKSDSSLSEQVAVDLARILQTAQRDPQTQQLLGKFQESGKEAFQNFASDMTPELIVKELVTSFESLQKLDAAMAKDPKGAVEEMRQAGMIPESRAQMYLENPRKLEEDTRKMLYFSIVSLGAAGGYLK